MPIDTQVWADADARRFIRAEWDRVCRGFVPAADREAVIELVLAAYGRPSRRYHNVAHVADCLRTLEWAAPQCREPGAARAALIFHDLVYDPRRNDNEERSAEWARDVLAAGGAAPAFTARVAELVLATKHAGAPVDPDARIVADTDLVVLGRPPTEFDAYERAIRLEYAHVPDDAFAAGRAKVLRHFLARPSIYATPAFHHRYEEPARRNLERSLARWDGRGTG